MGSSEQVRSIGRRIAARRSRLGLTQHDLAVKAATSRNLIAQWETGRCAPHITAITRVANALGTTAAYIAFGE